MPCWDSWTAYMQFQHAVSALYRLLKVVRDRFPEEHNVAIRGRIACVWSVLICVHGRNGGVCACMFICICLRWRTVVTGYVCIKDRNTSLSAVNWEQCASSEIFVRDSAGSLLCKIWWKQCTVSFQPVESCEVHEVRLD